MRADDHDMCSKDCVDLDPFDGVEMRHGDLKISTVEVHIVFANGTENIAIT